MNGAMSSPSKEQASRFLRSVDQEHSFLFYQDVGEYTGASAKNLEEFLSRLQTIGVRSIQFHAGRGDFENWIVMLGDDWLSRQLKEAKRGLIGEELRKRLVETVRTRNDFLKSRLTNTS